MKEYKKVFVIVKADIENYTLLIVNYIAVHPVTHVLVKMLCRCMYVCMYG